LDFYVIDNNPAAPYPDIKQSHRYVGGKDAWKKITNGTAGADADGNGTPDPWTFIETREAFKTLADGETPNRVLGIPQTGKSLQFGRSGSDTLPESQLYDQPFIESVPSLAEMTAAALNVLDNDPDGLFLMVEGGAIDWAGHANNSNRNIEEEVEFNKAVQAVITWVEKTGGWDNTLVIVTGDHETGYMTGPGSGIDSTEYLKPLKNNGKGKLPGMEWHSKGHTNSLLPLFAKGKGSEIFHRFADRYDPVRGRFTDNAEVGQAMFLLME